MNLSEPLKAAKEYSEIIVILLSMPWIFWAFAIVFFLFRFLNKNFHLFFNEFKNKKRSKIELLYSYMSKNISDKNVEKVASDVCHAHIFRVATGIYAEEKRRNLLIDVHNKISHIVSWEEIGKVQRRFELNADSKIFIKNLSFMEKFEYYYFFTIGMLALAIASIVFTLAFSYFITNNSLFFTLLLTSLLAFFAAILCSRQTRPINIAKKIKKELECQEKTAQQLPNFINPVKFQND